MLKMNQTAPCHMNHRGEQGGSLDDYKHFRHYSHIIDQYDFKINNKIMVEKIINPRRDKIIKDSLINVSPKYILRKKKFVPPSEKQENDRRNTLQKKSFKKSLLCRKKQSLNELAFKRTHRSNFAPYNSVSSALESNTEASLNEGKEANSQPRYLEARGSSLRNNFVGKIVKNFKRQGQIWTAGMLAQSVDSNYFGNKVQSVVLGESFDNNSNNESNRIKKEQNKLNYRKQSRITRIAYRQGHPSQIKENFESKANVIINQMQ